MTKLRVRNPKTKQIVGYEMLRDGTWYRSENGYKWEPGTIPGEGWQREQYVHRTDRYGDDIYENDILQTYEFVDDEWVPIEPVEVLWDTEDNRGWLIHACANDVYMFPRSWSEYEIIGDNVTEPELLWRTDKDPDRSFI